MHPVARVKVGVECPMEQARGSWCLRGAVGVRMAGVGGRWRAGEQREGCGCGVRMGVDGACLGWRCCSDLISTASASQRPKSCVAPRLSQKGSRGGLCSQAWATCQIALAHRAPANPGCWYPVPWIVCCFAQRQSTIDLSGYITAFRGLTRQLTAMIYGKIYASRRVETLWIDAIYSSRWLMFVTILYCQSQEPRCEHTPPSCYYAQPRQSLIVLW